MRVTVILLFLSSLAAVARVGETYETIEKRIGAADFRSFLRKGRYTWAFHQHNGVKITIECLDGTSSRERYIPITRKGAEELLMKHDSGKWEIDTTRAALLVYKGPRGLTAYYSVPDMKLTVTDGRVIQALREKGENTLEHLNSGPD